MPERYRQAEAVDGQHLVESFKDAGSDTGRLLIKAAGEIAQQPLGFIGIAELPSLPEDPVYRCMQRLWEAPCQTTEERFGKGFAINTRGLAFTVKKALLLLNDGEAIIVCVPPSRGGASTG